MGAGKDDVGSLGRQRKVILDQHLDVAEPCIGKIRGEYWKTPTPRSLLCWRRTAAGPIEHLFQQLLDQ
jgi:hypothetical protein